MQTVFRNPLADPYLLGVSSGSGLGVAFFILGAPLLGLNHSVFWQPWELSEPVGAVLSWYYYS